MKTSTSWFSERVDQHISMTRWGHYGTPVLMFPTAGGDHEEIERMGVVDACAPLLGAGRIKLYSVDSIAGRAFAARWGSLEHRCWLLNGFEEYIAHEVVPAIRIDCASDDIEVIAAGASIGAFKAVSVTCRYPQLFRAAIGMSGSYDLETMLGFSGDENFYYSSPRAFLPGLEGPILDRLKQRYILMAYGEGRWENPDESWRMADMLGAKGIPNRVDAWGSEWDHDWITWRKMAPTYLDELVA